MTHLNRRLFIQTLLLASTYPLLAGCADDSAEPATPLPTAPSEAAATSSPRFDVIVIGAGMAGLGAARRLHDEGYRVVVVEARDRLGGRVWSNRVWPGVSLDMGGSWIHGIEDNPLTELAEQFEVETAETDDEAIILYDANGEEVDEDDADELDETVEELLAEVDSIREEVNQDRPLGPALTQVINDWELSAEEERAVWFALNGYFEQDYAADVNELSLLNWDQDGEFDGEEVIFPGGYDQLAQGLARGLDVRLQHVVRRVAYGSSGVEVTTDRGMLAADYAIVTLPLAILQKGTVEFAPSLPAAKQASIGRLGMGLLNKLYLRFPDVFWDDDADWIGHLAERKGEWSYFFNHYKYSDQPILLAFNAGAFAQELEGYSDQETVEACMEVLRTIYGNNIPQPEAWQISRWAADPFAGGSYSYNAVGSSNDDRDSLAEPVAGRLFFAGEATAGSYFGTVHGAYLSGLRAAEEIIG